MTKGAYTVGGNSANPPRKDTSFRSFICALLIFLAICLIIFLASINWGDGKKEPTENKVNQKENDDGAEVLEHTGYKHNKSHEKIITKTESATEFTTERASETHERTIDEVEPTPYFKLTTKVISEDDNIAFITVESTTEKIKEETTLSNFPHANDVTSEESTTKIEKNYDTNSPTIFEKIILENATERTTVTDTISSSSTDIPESTLQTLETTIKEILAVTEDIQNEYTTNIISKKFEDSPTSTQEVETDRTTPAAVTLENVEVTTEIIISTGETLESMNPLNGTERSFESLESEFTEITTTNTANSTEQENFSDHSTLESINSSNRFERGFEDLETVITESTTKNVANSTISTKLVDFSDDSTSERSTNSATSPIKSIEEYITKVSTRPTTITEDDYLSTEQQKEEEDETQNIKRKIKTSAKLKLSKPDLCITASCNKTASQILGQMDHSDTGTLPCEDFYQFSCEGSYYNFEEQDKIQVLTKQLHKVSDDSPKYMKDFKLFYDTCVQYENDFNFNYTKRIEGVKKLLADVGQFQFESESGTLPYDLTDLVSKLILRQSMPLFDIGIDVDNETSNLILQVTLPQKSSLKMGLDDWSGLVRHKELCLHKQKSELFAPEINLNNIYELYVNCQKNWSHYLDSIDIILNEFEIFSKLNETERRKEIQNIRFSVEFDILVQQIFSPEILENLVNVANKKYNLRTISKLENQYPLIKWQKLFETLTGHQLTEDVTVQVYFENHLNDMFKSLNSGSPKSLNNAFLAIYANNLFINTVISVQRSNRESYCFDLSKKLLPDVWAHISKSAVSIKDQLRQSDKVENLFKDLKTNFCNSFNEQEWIDDNTMELLQSKCKKIKMAIFTPPDETVLLTNSQNLSISSDYNHYQTNLINLLEHSKRKIYSLERALVSANTVFSYFLDPLSIKPMTFYADTTIYVPLGLMKRVSSDLPNYLEMARTGFPLAQEIVRHFDPVGMRHGIQLEESAEITYFAFVATFDTMMTDYPPRKLQHKKISFKIDNGTLSTNERFVDTTAFRLVWDSINSTINNEKQLMWISSYSNKKVFFIASAQEFCSKTSILDYMLQVFEERLLPSVLRVENILSNFKEFSDEFACIQGSGMNPQTQKMQFPYLEMNNAYSNEDDISSKK